MRCGWSSVTSIWRPCTYRQLPDATLRQKGSVHESKRNRVSSADGDHDRHLVLGFWAPWIEALDIGGAFPLLEWLALEASRTGLLRFTVCHAGGDCSGLAYRAVGAVLRVWGAAYLGYGTVHHGEMQAGGVMADGPYRYVRNPLYLGGWCMMAAMSLLMPPTGALFTHDADHGLFASADSGRRGISCGTGRALSEYLRAVPRLVPRLRAGLPAAGNKPHWMTAFSRN